MPLHNNIKVSNYSLDLADSIQSTLLKGSPPNRNNSKLNKRLFDGLPMTPPLNSERPSQLPLSKYETRFQRNRRIALRAMLFSPPTHCSKPLTPVSSNGRDKSKPASNLNVGEALSNESRRSFNIYANRSRVTQKLFKVATLNKS